MAVVNVESLLKPLSEENPCGENLRWDRRLLEVERLTEGKEADAFDTSRSAEEPDWREVRDGCVELFARGKHLRIASLLTLAAVRMEGYPGLRDGLKVLHGLLEQYWEQVFPQLDAEDNNDPTERVNAFSMLSTPMATFGDKFKFLDRVYEAAICESRQLGQFSMRDVAIAAGTLEVPDAPDKPRPTLQVIDAAFAETDAARLEEIGTAIEEAGAAAEAIEAIFNERCGNGIGPNLEPLRIQLRDAGIYVRRHAGGGEEGVGDGGEGAADSPSGGGRVRSLEGDVNSPNDAQMALEKISRYYSTHEPSSPVGLIVSCAQMMIGKSFLDISKVLPPDVVSMLVGISTPASESSNE